MSMTEGEREKCRKSEDRILQIYREADLKESAYYKYRLGLSREDRDVIESNVDLAAILGVFYSFRFQEERDSYMDMKPLELVAVHKEQQAVMERLKENETEKCIQAKYTGPRGDVVIQEDSEEIEEETFVEFGRKWQEGFLTSVTIPGSVRKIGSGAFSGCRNLTRVIIPESVEIIGERAFEGCTGLAEVIIPERFRERGGDIFPDCENLHL